jgi:hypothetical protein
MYFLWLTTIVVTFLYSVLGSSHIGTRFLSCVCARMYQGVRGHSYRREAVESGQHG